LNEIKSAVVAQPVPNDPTICKSQKSVMERLTTMTTAAVRVTTTTTTTATATATVRGDDDNSKGDNGDDYNGDGVRGGDDKNEEAGAECSG